MVVMPRMNTHTVLMAMRVIMEKRMPMAQRIPSRLLFPPARTVLATMQSAFYGKTIHLMIIIASCGQTCQAGRKEFSRDFRMR